MRSIAHDERYYDIMMGRQWNSKGTMSMHEVSGSEIHKVLCEGGGIHEVQFAKTEILGVHLGEWFLSPMWGLISSVSCQNSFRSFKFVSINRDVLRAAVDFFHILTSSIRFFSHTFLSPYIHTYATFFCPLQDQSYIMIRILHIDMV